MLRILHSGASRPPTTAGGTSRSPTTAGGDSGPPTAAGGDGGLSEAEFLRAVAKSPYAMESVQDHGAANEPGGKRQVLGLAAAESGLTRGKTLAIDAKRFLCDKKLSGTKILHQFDGSLPSKVAKKH